MGKMEIKFSLNFSRDKRDIDCISTDYEDSEYNGHCCHSFGVLDKAGEGIFPSDFFDKSLEEIKEEGYTFKARRFNIKGLSKGDYGILKEKSKKTGKMRYYIMKIREVNELSHFDGLKDTSIAEYINKNVEGRKNYTASYIIFDTDRRFEFTENTILGEELRGEDLIQEAKLNQGTLRVFPNSITIEWDINR